MRSITIPPSSLRDRLWIARGEFGRAARRLASDHVLSVNGMVTEDLERTPPDEAAMIAPLVESFVAAKKHQETLSGPYVPGAEWKAIIDNEWASFRSAVETGDTGAQASFLRNFFRNEALSGFWGGDKMFAQFSSGHGSWRPRARAETMNAQLAVWRELFPHTPIATLNTPLIGNPWGYVVDGNLLYEPVCEYHYQADYFARLVGEIERPTIVEIGGGFGGLGYYVRNRIPGARYVGLDLPEVALLQSYYLSVAFPKAKLLTYREGMTSVELDGFDMAVLPNFMLPHLSEQSADLVANVRSLSEMPQDTIEEYLQQIDRTGRLFFFHENIFKPRLNDLHGIPSSEWPAMEKFVEVASAESRWPRYDATSAYPCRENLLIRRSAICS